MLEARVERAKLIGLEGVQLAPVWAALVLADNRLEGREVTPVVDLEVVVDGDVSGLALVRGRESDFVSGGNPDLDREAEVLVMIINPGPKGP